MYNKSIMLFEFEEYYTSIVTHKDKKKKKNNNNKSPWLHFCIVLSEL